LATSEYQQLIIRRRHIGQGRQQLVILLAGGE